MPTVAVTGASGFIGRRLIERLCRDGIRVRALVRKRQVQADVADGLLTSVQGGLGDDASIAQLIDGVDAVVHLAGLIKARTRAGFFEANTEGTRHLAALMAAQSSSGARLASSAARRAPSGSRSAPKLVAVSSLAAREPGLSSYAASKRAGEEALIALGDALPWTILRPPAVYGPGDPETLSFFKATKLGIGSMLGGEDARFSLLHVDDLAAAIHIVLDRTTADRMVLELDDGAEGGHSWRSMIEAAERVFERRIVRLRVPAPLLRTLGMINAGLRVLPGYTPMLTLEKVRELTHPNWVADRRPILGATAWKPAIPLDSGFSATVDWYRLHSWL